jgi:hypothetical protein
VSEPTLEQYPGYYPAGSKPFWSRTKVGLATGLAGLIVGLAGGGSEAEEPVAADNGTAASDVQADLDEALAATADLSDQLRDQREEAADRSAADARAAKAAQAKAVRAAVAEVRREERKKASAAVAAAKREAAAAVAPPSSPIAPLAAAPSASTDPRFSYCYEANDAGYGPYYQGQDPEYAWYDDRDGDGIVCET